MPAEQMREAACPTPMHHPLSECSICHPAPTAREELLQEMVAEAEAHGLYGATAEPVEIDRLPTARETTADELAEAERAVHELLDVGLLVDKEALATYVAEYDERGARDRLLRHYLGTIANRIGRPTRWDALSEEGEIEHVGEGVLAELERLRDVEQAARSAMFDRPSAPGRERLRGLLGQAR